MASSHFGFPLIFAADTPDSVADSSTSAGRYRFTDVGRRKVFWMQKRLVGSFVRAARGRRYHTPHGIYIELDNPGGRIMRSFVGAILRFRSSYYNL